MPEEIAFATKIEIAREMIGAALEAQVSCHWVVADALYGSDCRLRRMLEERCQPYVLAVRSNHHLRFLTREGLVEDRPEDYRQGSACRSRDDACRRRRGEGLTLVPLGTHRAAQTTDEGFERWLLIRRSCKEPDKPAYYLVFAPQATPLDELAGAAGLRWTIEECFERAKDDLGLDHCEARSWHGWHCHMSLVMA